MQRCQTRRKVLTGSQKKNPEPRLILGDVQGVLNSHPGMRGSILVKTANKHELPIINGGQNIVGRINLCVIQQEQIIESTMCATPASIEIIEQLTTEADSSMHGNEYHPYPILVTERATMSTPINSKWPTRREIVQVDWVCF